MCDVDDARRRVADLSDDRTDDLQGNPTGILNDNGQRVANTSRQEPRTVGESGRQLRMAAD